LEFNLVNVTSIRTPLLLSIERDLDEATSSSSTSATILMVESGAKVNNGSRDAQPLHAACKAGNAATVKNLLEVRERERE
jgi:ankyrin repeat protein